MDNDDQPIGTVLSRRDVLKLLGLGSAAALMASCAPGMIKTITPIATDISATSIEAPISTTATSVSIPVPACVVRPEMTEGPYFVDEMLNRSDIRVDPSDGVKSSGAPLDLTFNVSQVNSNGCAVLPNAQVDIWHCDAFGVYSDVENVRGKKFLRGYQITDANGGAKFVTVYPGWYPGRTVHIHFKIRINGYDFTSQLFFDDAFTDQVYLQEPYSQRGERNVRNDRDGIYGNGGSQLLLDVIQNGSGYSAVFNIGLQI